MLYHINKWLAILSHLVVKLAIVRSQPKFDKQVFLVYINNSDGFVCRLYKAKLFDAALTNLNACIFVT